VSRAAAVFALLALAANSILCRMALGASHIDPASFTGVRVLAGAVTLWAVVPLGGGRGAHGGSWRSALALLAHAIALSFAYVALTAGTGALLLFGAVQRVMIAAGFVSGERIDRTIALGWLLAVTGLILLLRRGFAAPPPLQAASMLPAGVGWGVYALRGRGSGDALGDTAGNSCARSRQRRGAQRAAA
jgi:hypothetical protein